MPAGRLRGTCSRQGQLTPATRHLTGTRRRLVGIQLDVMYEILLVYGPHCRRLALQSLLFVPELSGRRVRRLHPDIRPPHDRGFRMMLVGRGPASLTGRVYRETVFADELKQIYRGFWVLGKHEAAPHS